MKKNKNVVKWAVTGFEEQETPIMSFKDLTQRNKKRIEHIKVSYPTPSESDDSEDLDRATKTT